MGHPRRAHWRRKLYRSKIKGDNAIIVPAGAHWRKPLQLYTLYAPPEHRDGTVCATKADADALQARFDGKTSE